MNVKTVRNTEPRAEYPNITNLKITGYGHNNLYPQEIKSIVACSESGTSCLKRYIDFIQGNGFKDVSFAETIINRQGSTTDDLLQQIASDLGTWGGFSIHINYNILGQAVEFSHTPWENCRLGEEDESGYIGKIAVFPDWSGKKKRNNKTLKPKEEDIDYIDVFNPKKEVILSQIELAGGIDKYKGQILWVSISGDQEYPTTIYDCVVTQLSTEEGLGNIAYRNARNNFLPAGMLITKKSQDTRSSEGVEEKTQIQSNEGISIADAVSGVQTDIKTNKIIHFEVEYEEDEPKFVPFQGANYDKDFSVTSDTACEKIYAAFGQEVWHRLRKGSLGFSSGIMRDTYDVYSSTTGSERRMIERAFDKIFRYWHEPLSTTDFTIQPLKYISSETPDNN